MTEAQRVKALTGAVSMSAAVILAAAPFVAKWEGTRQAPYADLGGVLTVCTGHTGPDVKLGQSKTSIECEAILRADLLKHAELIRPCVPASTPVESQAAFLSLAFNIGGEAFCSSALAAKLKAGDLAGACAQLGRWVNVRGKRVQGLVARRADETTLCTRGLFQGLRR